jgi:hypothetical protein
LGRERGEKKEEGGRRRRKSKRRRKKKVKLEKESKARVKDRSSNKTGLESAFLHSFTDEIRSVT